MPQLSSRVTRRALLAYFAVLVATSVLAQDKAGPKPGGISYEFDPDQVGVLNNLKLNCLPPIFGDFVSSGNEIGVLLSQGKSVVCLGNTPSSEPATVSLSKKVLPLAVNGINLLRFDQNFGGSKTLTRYAIVSVMQRKIPVDSAPVNETILLVHYVLPPSVSNDEEATKLATGIAQRF